MPHSTVEGFYSKSYVDKHLGRARRTLTKDISAAIRNDDTELLGLLRLVTKDGEVRHGTDIKDGDVRALEQEGLKPHWLLHPDFVSAASKRASRSSANTPDDAEPPSPIASIADEVDSPPANTESVEEQEDDEQAKTPLKGDDGAFQSPDDLLASLPEEEGKRLAVAEALLKEKQAELIRLDSKYNDIREDNQKTLQLIADRLKGDGVTLIAPSPPATVQTQNERAPSETKDGKKAIDVEVISSGAKASRPVNKPKNAPKPKKVKQASSTKKTTRKSSSTDQQPKKNKKKPTAKKERFPTFKRFTNFLSGNE